MNQLDTDRYMPTGQRLLQAGYTRVTRRDLWRLLGCDEIQRLEIEMVQAEARQWISAEHPEAVNPTVQQKGDGWVCLEWNDPRTGWFSGGGRHLKWFKQVQTVTLSYVPLDHYLDQPIPTDLIEKVRAARVLGAEEFQVVAPILETRHTDPAIVGKLGDEMILIGVWG